MRTTHPLPRLLATLSLAALGFVPRARAQEVSPAADTTGAKPLSRGAALELALQQNPQLAASRARVAEAESLKGQANAARWPEISARVLAGPTLKADLVNGTGVQSTKPAYSDIGWSDLTFFFSGTLTVTQPIYTFGKIGHRHDAAEHDIQARVAQALITRGDVAVKVAKLYEAFLFARDAARSYEDIENTVNRSILSTQERLKQGSSDVSDDDLLRLQVGLGLAQVALNRARAGMHQAAAGVRAYLGLPAGADLVVSEDTLQAVSATLPAIDKMVDEALHTRPELKALQEGADAYEELARAEHAGWFPDLFAVGFVSAAWAPGRELVDTRYYVDPFYHFVPGFVVGARWKLQADMPSKRAAEQRAKADRLRELRKWAVEGIPAEVRKAWEDAQRAHLDIPIMDEAARKARQWVVSTTADYAVGLGDSRAVTDSVQAYAAVRTNQLEARYRYNVAMAELSQATGAFAAEDFDLYPGHDSASIGSEPSPAGRASPHRQRLPEAEPGPATAPGGTGGTEK